MALMAAEELGIDVYDIRPVVGDTESVGFTDITEGSRATFATGMAVVEACRKMVVELRGRAAKMMGVDVDDVDWVDGQAVYTGSDGDKNPLPLAAITAKAKRTGGPLTTTGSLEAHGAGPGFAVHLCDLEVDQETGVVRVVRYTASQDAGTAIHPSYVEGQIQGGVAQGVGWALNEEYVYDSDGVMENPDFLDYRVPVASDLPMIDAIIVEVPNPAHPYGVRGVGETGIVPPIPAGGQRHLQRHRLPSARSADVAHQGSGRHHVQRRLRRLLDRGWPARVAPTGVARACPGPPEFQPAGPHRGAR